MISCRSGALVLSVLLAVLRVSAPTSTSHPPIDSIPFDSLWRNCSSGASIAVDSVSNMAFGSTINKIWAYGYRNARWPMTWVGDLILLLGVYRDSNKNRNNCGRTVRRHSSAISVSLGKYRPRKVLCRYSIALYPKRSKSFCDMPSIRRSLVNCPTVSAASKMLSHKISKGVV